MSSFGRFGFVVSGFTQAFTSQGLGFWVWGFGARTPQGLSFIFWALVQQVNKILGLGMTRVEDEWGVYWVGFLTLRCRDGRQQTRPQARTLQPTKLDDHTFDPQACRSQQLS